MRILGLTIVRERRSMVRAAEQIISFHTCPVCASYRCPECWHLVLYAGDHAPVCSRYVWGSVMPA